MDNPAMEEAKKLVAQRDAMEQELRELKHFLTENNTNMSDSLVDDDGYPRNDIDVYGIRKTRVQIIRLENDLRSLMKEIEQALVALHSSANPVSVQTTYNSRASHGNWSEKMETDKDCHSRTSNDVFVRVEDVSPGSPAAGAGLTNGDQIIQFGSLCSSNFSNIQQVAEVVRNSVNQTIHVTVFRDLHAERLTLIPKQWNGQGLLGCRVVPTKKT